MCSPPALQARSSTWIGVQQPWPTRCCVPNLHEAMAYALATDVADYLVARGVPFREAHHAVGALVKEAEVAGVPLPQLPLEKVRSVHKAFAADWTECFDLGRAMKMRERAGMTGPKQVAREIARWRKVLNGYSG